MRPTCGIVLVGGLWALATGTAEAQPPVPPQMAPWMAANHHGGYDILPTGVDDYDHAQWALDNADQRGLIQFETGPGGEADFYFSHGLTRFNWVGTIRGESMDETVLHTLEGYGGGMWLFEMLYDQTLGYEWSGPGRLQVSDLKVVVDGPAATWINHGEPSNEVPGVVVVVDLHFIDLYFGGAPPPWPDIGVDLTFERIWAVGEAREGEGYAWGRSLLWPIDVEWLQGGSHRIHQVRQDTTHFLYLRSMLAAEWEISELDSKNIDPGTIAVTYQCLGCDTTVSSCTTTDASLLVVSGNPSFPPGSFDIHDNRIDQPPGAWWGGIEIWENGGSSDYAFESNRFLAEPDGWPPLALNGVDDALVVENRVEYAAASPTFCFLPRCGGILLSDGTAEMTENTVLGSTHDGILLIGGQATLRENRVTGSAMAGVAAIDGSTATLEENQLSDNAGGDVYVDETSTVFWAD